MKNLIIILFIAGTSLNNLFGQQVHFEFTATMNYEMTLGKSFTPSYESMEIPMKISLRTEDC